MTEPRTRRAVEYMRLGDIRPAPRNPKTHDGDGISASLTRFGVADLPVLDERTGLLVAGHGRLKQLQDMMGRATTPPEGVTVDGDGMWLMPVIRGWASKSDAEAEAYLVGSNRLAERGGWDDNGLAELLADLASTDFDLAMVAGWDAGALEDLLAAADAIPTFPDEQPAAGGYPLPPGDPFAPERPAPVAGGAGERVHDQVPATGSGYAETPEQEAARADRIAGYEPRAPKGTVEMILIYAIPDRDEVGRLVAAIRKVLGADVKTADVVLRALRLMTTVLDDRDNPQLISLAQLAARVGVPE